MKKLKLLLGMLLTSVIVFGQYTNTTTTYLNNELQQGIDAIQESIDEMQEIINEKQIEIDNFSSEQLELSIERKIDSLEFLIDINEDIIEDLEEAQEDLEEAAEELLDAISEIDIDIDNCDYDYDYDYDCDDDGSRKKKKFKGHWAGMQFGLNSYVSPSNTLSLPTNSDFMATQLNKSWEFSINPLQFSIPFFNRYVGAVTGAGFTFNNYELVQNVNLVVDNDGVLAYNQSDFTFEKNRFKMINLNVPFLIEIQIPVNKKDERMFISGGVIGTMNLDGTMKLVYNDGNSKIKYKDKISNWPLTQFSYQATARVGYDDWYIYANYSLMSMFEQNKGPELYPVSAGIGFRF